MGSFRHFEGSASRPKSGFVSHLCGLGDTGVPRKWVRSVISRARRHSHAPKMASFRHLAHRETRGRPRMGSFRHFARSSRRPRVGSFRHPANRCRPDAHPGPAPRMSGGWIEAGSWGRLLGGCKGPWRSPPPNIFKFRRPGLAHYLSSLWRIRGRGSRAGTSLLPDRRPRPRPVRGKQGGPGFPSTKSRDLLVFSPRTA